MAQGQHIDRAGVMVPTKAKLLMASSVGHKGEKMVSFTQRTVPRAAAACIEQNCSVAASKLVLEQSAFQRGQAVAQAHAVAGVRARCKFAAG